MNIVCKCCGGSGSTPLPDELKETLEALNIAGAATAHDLKYIMGWRGTVGAINGRLESLRKLSLVTRRKDGRYWIYKAC